MLGIGVGGIALNQAVPLGRVWSFPKQIVLPSRFDMLYGFAPMTPEFALLLTELDEEFRSDEAFLRGTLWPVKIGSPIKIRTPQRWAYRPAGSSVSQL